MQTRLLVIQGDITQLKVDAIAETPVWSGKDANDGDVAIEAVLEKAYVDALSMAIRRKATSIAFPDAGTSGYPRDTAAEVALKTVYNFLKHSPGKLSEVIFACWDSKDYHLYVEMLGGENLILQS